MDRDSGKMDVHPWHQHSLERLNPKLKDVDRDSGRICQVCMCPLTLQMKQEQITPYYSCKERCYYYLHDECYWLIQDLKGKREVHHPLHPQHHLILHGYIDAAGDDSPNLIRSEFEFEFNTCNFCNQVITSEFFFHCSGSISLSCDFYLHIGCSTGFMHHPALLSNFHIQHFLHHPHDIHHRLSPYIILNSKIDDCYDICCNGCGNEPLHFAEDRLVLKCITCDIDFYLHVQCSKDPKQISEHCFHPQHPLTLLPPSTSFDFDLRCHTCRRLIEFDTFIICCTDVCCNFNLCIQCALLKPNMIPNGHHHPLVHFDKIYLDDVLCSACKTPCKYDSFRCITCNYNIHSHCISLPIIIDEDDVHVHPFTLTLSFVEDKWGHYYCDICETKRDPNHSVYSCEQCPFVAHIQCALPNDHPLMLEGYFSQKIQDGSNKSADEDDKTLVNSNEVISVDRSIFLQLDSEVGKLGEVVKQLIIKVKQGEQLTETLLEELDERQANTEAKLRELKKNF